MYACDVPDTHAWTRHSRVRGLSHVPSVPRNIFTRIRQQAASAAQRAALLAARQPTPLRPPKRPYGR
eukprot:6886178-Prymnesium_polylepis.1